MKCFVFIGDKLLLLDNNLPDLEDIESIVNLSGELLNVSYANAKTQCVSLPYDSLPDPLPEKWQLIPLRECYGIISDDDFAIAGKSRQILWWDSHNRYCGVCGTKMKRESEICLKCPECNNEVFPQVSPAIIVLIKKGEDEVLMVHARNFKGNFYGLVAGFVETGESLEECVVREVMEETGIKIKNIRYIGSQTWPYPSQLMVGFTAEYEAGEIHLQEEELSAGKFWHRDNLPPLPRKLSIARKMIELWKERKI